MSYNTRRTGNFGGQGAQAQSQPQVQSVGSIGQRRPVVTNNFVPGGQLNAQNKGGVQMAAQQRPPHQQPQQQVASAQNTNTSVNFRNQNQRSSVAAQGYQTQPPPPQQQQPPVQQPAKVVESQPPVLPGVNPPNPALENTNGEGMEVDPSDTPKKKPFWAKGGKVSKKEKMRRRNVRLSKMLQPKNAVMILNELVKNTCYAVEEIPNKTDMNQFKASVLVEDVEHIGYGRSKIHAKNSAAEAALKHLIVSNKLSEMKKDDEGNEKMDVAEDGTQPPLPWQHVASFALYKLFTGWGEDPNKGPKLQPQLNASSDSQKVHENKPAKKMPDNPESMNPLMLINQMLPHALFEEIGRSGAPPNLTYSYRCSVDADSFIGTGSNKKAAKKMAAYGACHKILNIEYPKDVYVPGGY
ncbi:uncharacterized protein LOC108903465 [Anoplophora glabripennis]|nr:uncharacterized protein LOC108903465 [Anoplophora glabripennis]